MKQAPLFNSIPLTDARRSALAELAKCPNGSCAVRGIMDGAVLATLVQMGLAERMESDPLGGCRYQISSVGREVAP